MKKRQWEYQSQSVTARATLAKLFRAGWEPFAVTGARLHLRRQVWK